MYIFLSIVAFFIIALVTLQLLTIKKAKRSKGKKLTGLTGTLKNLEKRGTKGLVYFYSPSCGACRAQTPVIKELQKQHSNIYDVDVSKDMNTARIFGIMATPTTINVQDGVIKEVLIGAKTKQAIEKLIIN